MIKMMTKFERNFEYAKLDVQEAILDAIEYVTDNTTQDVYDKRASKKAFKKLQTIKFTYGCLADFADYLMNISKYFTIKENKEAMKKAGRTLKKFINSFEMIL